MVVLEETECSPALLPVLLHLKLSLILAKQPRWSRWFPWLSVLSLTEPISVSSDSWASSAPRVLSMIPAWLWYQKADVKPKAKKLVCKGKKLKWAKEVWSDELSHGSCLPDQNQTSKKSFWANTIKDAVIFFFFLFPLFFIFCCLILQTLPLYWWQLSTTAGWDLWGWRCSSWHEEFFYLFFSWCSYKD